MIDASRGEGVEGLAEIVTHQVNRSGSEFSSGVEVRDVTFGGMNSHFGGREGEDEPTLSGIHMSEMKHVAKECPVGLRLAAIQQQVYTTNPIACHAMNFRT